MTTTERFAQDAGITVSQTSHLLRLANRAGKLQEATCNTDDVGVNERADRAATAFETFAKSLGFATKWPGLYPLLEKGGRNYHLPY